MQVEERWIIKEVKVGIFQSFECKAAKKKLNLLYIFFIDALGKLSDGVEIEP